MHRLRRAPCASDGSVLYRVLSHWVVLAWSLYPFCVLESWIPRRSSLAKPCADSWCLGYMARPSGILTSSGLSTMKLAASSLIRGSSSQADVHMIAQFSHVILTGLRCRVWYEWINSASNPSDGLSREGLHDSWTQLQNWNVGEYAFPAELLPDSFLEAFLVHLDMVDSG